MAEEGNLVVLNVYDLSQGLARQLSTSFLGKAIEGIWHTGVVVYGNEYYFGGGIQSCPQGQTPYGKPIKVVELGYTEVPKEVFEEYLQEIKPRYTEQTYSLLHHNCNNFSDEISQFLVGVSIPEYILKLPQEVMNSPMGALIMPMIQQFETILRFGGVPQPPHLVQGANSASPFATTGRTVTSTIANGSVKQSVNQATVTTLPDAAGLVAAPKSSTNVSSEASVKMVDKVSIDSTSEPKDPLGEARQRVQQEITREFAALMAEGQYRASEAAALAARRVMERHGRGSGLISES